MALPKPLPNNKFPALALAFAENSIQVGAIALDREHAIELAGNLLVASGRTTPQYTDEMIGALEQHGPYMVIAPGIALVHGRPSEAVLETGLSLVVLAEPIEFGHATNDPVRLVIGLCAFDHSSHIEMMQELALALSNVEFVNSLLNAPDSEHIRLLFEI